MLNKSFDRKQKTLGIAIGAFLILGSMLAVYLKNKNGNEDQPIVAKNEPSDVVVKKYSAITGGIDEQQIWIEKQNKSIEDVKKSNEALNEQIRNLKRSLEKKFKQQQMKMEKKLQEEKRKLAYEIEKQKKKIQELKREKAKRDKSKFIDEKVDSVPQDRSSLSPQNIRREVIGERNGMFVSPGKKPIVIKNSFYSNKEQKLSPEAQKKIREYQAKGLFKPEEKPLISLDLNGGEVKEITDNGPDENNVDKSPKKANPQNIAVKEAEVKTIKTFVPAGTFTRAILLGGVDAPTGGQADSNPYPTILQFEGLSMLPNNIKKNMKYCRLIAASYGDISSERVTMQLQTLSCVDKKDRVIERKVKGYVFGEDGKHGVRGRVVTKQGQVLANALLAGIGAGIGKSFSQQATTYNQTPLGTTASVDPNQVANVGLANGVSEAMDRLSKYYISLAEKLFPVIEVDAGRMVDVVFTEGFDLISGDNSNFSDTNDPSGIVSGAKDYGLEMAQKIGKAIKSKN